MKTKKGFTLIELLVVVLIIGILAAIAVPQYKKAVAKARFTQLLVAVNTIWSAQQRYMLANGERSLDLSALDISIGGGTVSKHPYTSDSALNKGAIDFDWGICAFSLDPTRGSILCSLKNFPLTYSRNFYSTTHKWCCSAQKLGQDLCSQEIQNADKVFDTDSYCGTGGKVYQKN